jgi:hypothetical protein
MKMMLRWDFNNYRAARRICIKNYFKRCLKSKIIKRTINVFVFFITIFITIFIPRRYLIRSRGFKFFCLWLYRKYPEIHYIRMVLTGWSFNIMFLLDEYISYYIKRIMHLICIGTGHVGIKPYFSLTKEESLLRLTYTMELWNSVTYLYLKKKWE